MRCASTASKLPFTNARRQLGEVGAGIQLGPNAVKVLRALGIERALRPLTSEPVNYVSLAWDDARICVIASR